MTRATNVNSQNSCRFLTLLFIALVSLNFDCKKNVTPTPLPPTETLKDVAPFPVGAAVDPGLLQNNFSYRAVVTSELSSITAENVLKWPAVHPSQNTFDFTQGDALLNYATANNKRLHGHNLCWYAYNPSWLNNFTGDSAAWEQLFKTHIETVVGHYKGKIGSWDVVNEAFHDDGTLRVEDINPGDNFDDGCIWARHIGKDYIAKAFVYAHEADPDALLFYNEYGQEYSDAKAEAVVKMAADFKKRGIPISGLGIQMHININTYQAGITNAISKLAATGLKIHISELDISVNPGNDPNIVYTSSIQLQQGNLFAFVVHQYRSLVPAAQQFGITTWNVGDADSWIRGTYNRKDWPLLFDDNYHTKSVYYAFQKALKN